ncbi:hypothetical protein HZH66_013150 [Vespula vulgaris]|uniref:Uncharacterized protein n=1 Tax=Vespula vulgaris TaxID=7454 RepID=A0A834J6S1_VESVU|nr:hypothetical protein HZH66_013150 [Vespula vulgaris]
MEETCRQPRRNKKPRAFPEWERADRQVALVIAALVKAAMVVSACLEVVYLILAECDVTQGPVRGHDEKERYVSVMRDTSGGTYDEEREQDLTMLRPKDVQQIAFIYNYSFYIFLHLLNVISSCKADNRPVLNVAI